MKLSWLCLLVIQGDKQIKLPNIRDTPVRRCDCEGEGQGKKGKEKSKKTWKEILIKKYGVFGANKEFCAKPNEMAS